MWWGFAGTLLWISLGLAYAIWGAPGNIWELKANELGDFMAGFFAPLAFGWLAFAVFLQRQELQEQRKQLKQNGEALKLQTVELMRSGDQLKLQAEYLARQVQLIEIQTRSEEIEDNFSELIKKIVSTDRFVLRILNLEYALFRKAMANGDWIGACEALSAQIQRGYASGDVDDKFSAFQLVRLIKWAEEVDILIDKFIKKYENIFTEVKYVEYIKSYELHTVAIKLYKYCNQLLDAKKTAGDEGN